MSKRERRKDYHCSVLWIHSLDKAPPESGVLIMIHYWEGTEDEVVGSL